MDWCVLIAAGAIGAAVFMYFDLQFTLRRMRDRVTSHVESIHIELASAKAHLDIERAIVNRYFHSLGLDASAYRDAEGNLLAVRMHSHAQTVNLALKFAADAAAAPRPAPH